MGDVVNVFTTRDPVEAEIVKNALEAAGISCFANGGQQAGFAGVFEIVLTVPSEFEAAARKIIESGKADEQT